MEQSKFYEAMFKGLLAGSSHGEALDIKSANQVSVQMESLTFKNGTPRVANNADLTAVAQGLQTTYKDIIGKIAFETDEGFGNKGQVSCESMLSKSQVSAGFQTLLAGYSKESLRKQLNPSKPSAPSGYVEVGGGVSESTFDNGSVALESFDGADKTENVYLSMVIAMGSARQEDLVEAFCPTVPVKAIEGGVYVTVRFPSFVKEYYMDRAAPQTVEEMMGRKPILKHVFDPEVMGQDRTLVVPNWNGADGNKAKDAQAWLVPGVEVLNNDRGESIKSGFYKAGVEVNILSLGQSQLDLVKRGVADNTDNLLPGVMMDKLLLQLQPQSAGNPAYIPVSLSGVNGRAFTDPQSGHNKQIAVNIVNERIAIKLGSVKDHEGSDVAFTGCSEAQAKTGYTLVYAITIHGTGNIQTGTFTVTATNFKLVDIVNPSGVSYKGNLQDPAIAQLAGAFMGGATKSEVAGYSLIAYKANTNLRILGQLMQSDGYAFYYPVAFKSPVTLQHPISNYTGNDGDFEELTNAINALTFQSNYVGVRKILQFRDDLRASHEIHAFTGHNPSENYNSALINPYFAEGTIDISKVVDSIKSQDRTDDIRAALHNQLREDALKMVNESNYKIAYDSIYGQEKKGLTVLVATHYHLGQYLCGKNEEGEYVDTFPLTADITCKVVTTMNPRFINTDGSISMLMTFSVTDKIGSIDTVQKLHPGFRLYAPVVTVSTTVTNGAIKQITQLIPKYEHHLTMKIMQSYSVTGISQVLGKLPVKFETV